MGANYLQILISRLLPEAELVPVPNPSQVPVEKVSADESVRLVHLEVGNKLKSWKGENFVGNLVCCNMLKVNLFLF